MAIYELIDDSDVPPLRAPSTSAVNATAPERKSVGVYTAEPVQPDGMLVNAVPNDADPKLKTILRHVERSICSRLGINVEQLEKVELSDKAHNKILAWAAYKAFDLEVTPEYLKKATLPEKAKAMAVLVGGSFATIVAFSAAGAHTWPGFIIGVAGQIIGKKWINKINDSADQNLPTVERAIQMKLDARDDKYRL